MSCLDYLLPHRRAGRKPAQASGTPIVLLNLDLFHLIGDGRVPAQLVQAAAAGGADASDRDAEPGADLGVRSFLCCFAGYPGSYGPLSCSGRWAQPGGRAQGTAQALPGWSCPGRGVQPLGQALAVGRGQHLLLPLPAELRADVGVHEHGLLLSARTLGRLACHQNDAPYAAALSSVNPAMLCRLPGLAAYRCSPAVRGR